MSKLKTNMSRYFQSDDIPTCTDKGDCFHTHYKIIVNNIVIKIGRYAIKQTKNIENRIIYSRKYNVSRKEYVNEWILITKNSLNKQE